MALPLISSKVPVSGQTSTQVPQPTHKEALMTGFGLPVTGPSPPVFNSARCTLHMAKAAPQCAQKAEPLGMGLLQRGHGWVATGAAGLTPWRAEALLVSFFR